MNINWRHYLGIFSLKTIVKLQDSMNIAEKDGQLKTEPLTGQYESGDGSEEGTY